ncbi:MAG: methylenetetrahydrofolate--tRNA-(uracil(54)-C(5))-methyltransferase (FADH(2)-oxidizing) TrmFO [Firmicutes bacterium]|nr:methylenetetrahydrofolate--tRNA-(uracil(54)-C(5))-methyltransferase (FADH(2)-oxidizing) TrmFO [Bacillota bacterium]
MTKSKHITVVGAGLAGCEAAWQAANRGVGVTLYEMKPHKYTPAHKYKGMAELVCSNSLRSAQVTNAIGLQKEELRRLGSLIMEAADSTAVPAGSALAVDRYLFSDYVTNKIRSHPDIEVREQEITEIPEGITVIATGPLTSDALSEKIAELIGEGYLSFFDAAAPIISAESINGEIVYAASRYGKGEASYLNCPMSKAEYEAFYRALVTAEEAKLHEFDKSGFKVFEGCMPVEVMAKRGEETLRFGPLKPVGLPDPRTGKEPYAVVQLRRENTAGTTYNLVGFQTHLTFPEQKRVFRMIPGLENAEFLRYGVMHRNTYLNSPRLLSGDYSMRERPELFFAGQMTGVEGYIESASSGWTAGVNAARRALGMEAAVPPPETMTGALAAYISDKNVTDFQPMNANYGLVPPMRIKGGKAARCEAYSSRALAALDEWRENLT